MQYRTGADGLLLSLQIPKQQDQLLLPVPENGGRAVRGQLKNCGQCTETSLRSGLGSKAETSGSEGKLLQQ